MLPGVNLTFSGWRAVRSATPARVGLLIRLVLLCGATMLTYGERAWAQTGLVAAYGFEEGTGNTTADASGNGNGGQIVSATWNSAGKAGGALDFLNGNAHVAVASSSSLSLSTNRMTVACWVYPTSLSAQWCTLLQRSNSAASWFDWQIYARAADAPTANYPVFRVDWNKNNSMDAGEEVQGDVPLTTNRWYFITCTYDGSAMRFYIDGTLRGTTTKSGGVIPNSGKPLWIGANDAWGEPFSGRIDEVRIYDQALSQTEIQQIMTTPVVATLPTLSISDGVLSEGDSGTLNALFTVTLSAASTQEVRVNYATANGSATAGNDYVTTSGVVVMAPGVTSQQIAVTVLGDKLDEPDENVFVNLASPVNARLQKSQGTLTITDDDPMPSLSIGNVSLSEGNAGTSDAVLTVQLSAANGQEVRVNYVTADGTASAGSDYQTTSGTLIMAAGTTSATLTVKVMGDMAYESDETFFVNLSGAVNATVTTTKGVGTIRNDDAAPEALLVTPGEDLVSSGVLGGPFSPASKTYTLKNTGTTALNWSVSKEAAWLDLQPAANLSGTLAAGAATTIEVSVGDAAKALAGGVYNGLVTFTNQTSGFVQSHAVTLSSLPGLSIDDVVLTEGHSGSVTATFTVSLSGVSAQAVSVNYATANGTASAGQDYQGASGTLSFPAGTTTGQIAITVNGDMLGEPDETFVVNLSNPAQGLIVKGQGQGTIRSDDPELMVNRGRLDFTLLPDETTSANLTLTNAGSRAISWVVSEALAGGALSAAGTLPRLASLSARGASVAKIDWDKKYRPDTLLVGFKKTVQANARTSLHAALGAKRVYASRRLPLDVVKIPQGKSIKAVAEAYAARADVAYVEPNYIWMADRVPNDPRFSELWSLHNTGQTGGQADADIDAPEAWESVSASPAVIVAVMDTGIDQTHEDLAANMWSNPAELNGQAGVDDDGNGIIDDLHGAKWNSGNGVPTSGDAWDDDYHGTHVAGIIGAVGNNGIGMTGVAWSVRLMSLKFLDRQFQGTTADGVAAMEYAIDKGARIINISWGQSAYSQAFKDAIDMAGAAGILVVASAGNENTDIDVNPHYPASYDSANVISVASSTNTDNKSWFSSWGQVGVDLAAPGSAIMSTMPGNGYGLDDGTSFAAPHVSGVAALLWAQNPGQSVGAVKSIILGSVDPNTDYVTSGPTPIATGGRLNVAKALVLGPTPTPTPTPVPGEVPWLSEAPASGSLAAGDSVTISVQVSAAELDPNSTHDAVLTLSTPDAGIPVAVPVSLAVRNRLQIGNASVTEGNSGTSELVFPVTLAWSPVQPVTVDWATADGTAKAGVDYQSAAGQLTFAAGVRALEVRIPVLGDTRLEPDKTLLVNLSNPVGTDLGSAQGVGTILDDDTVPDQISIDDNAPADPGPGDPQVSDPLEDGSFSHPFDSIQKAIDAARQGCTLIVAPGTYRENINLGGKNLILRSTDPTSATVVAGTVIDGGGVGPVVTFQGDEATSCALLGFTITHGRAAAGGGIFGAGTQATIRHNLVTSNTATVQGGGLSQCHGLLANNTISANAATLSGGGLDSCNGLILGNRVIGNTAESGGGLSACSGTIADNLMVNNVAQLDGGGLRECNGLILNNTITDNEVSLFDAGGGLSHCAGTIRNCIIWGNRSLKGNRAQLYASSVPEYSCIQPDQATVTGQGNINLEPRFVDSARGNYRLAADSPCLDAGNSASLPTDLGDMDEDGDHSEPLPLDLDAQPRVADSNADGLDSVDMGAYEYLALAAGEIQIPTVTGSPLDATVTIPIQGRRVSDLRAVTDLRISYDPKVLRLPSVNRVSAGELITGWSITALIDESTTIGQVRISGAGSSGVTAADMTVLFNLTFDVVGRPGHKTRLGMDAGYFHNTAGVGIPAWRKSGSFSIAALAGTLTLDGTVGYWPDPAHLGVGGVQMQLTPMVDQTQTSSTGAYQLQGLTADGNFTVVPSLNQTLAQEVISAYDAALILGQTVGNDSFNTWQALAADVNGNASVSAVDASLIMQYTVGLVSLPFPVGKICGFSPAERRYEPLGVSQSGQDYTMVIYGDVDGNWRPNTISLNRNALLTAFDADQSTAQVCVSRIWRPAGNRLNLEVSAENLQDLLAITDLQVAYSPTMLGVSDTARVTMGPLLEGAMSAIRLDESGGIIHFSAARATAISGDGVLLTISFDLKQVDLQNPSRVDLLAGCLEDRQGHEMAVTLTGETISELPNAVRDWSLYEE